MLNSFDLSVIALVKSALTGQKAEVAQDLDLGAVYKLAKSHRVIPLIYYGIVNSGINTTPELNVKLFNATVQSIAVSEKQKASMAKLSEQFEAAGIDFMPLKGTIIRDIYPKQEMRSMGDADVLIHYDQYDKMVPILEGMGMQFVKENENELAWNDHPFYLELHRYLVAPHHKDYFRYFGDGWRFARLEKEGSHKYVMSDEDYYVYLFAHFTKHYRTSGIGIKHMTDIWVYLKAKTGLDMDYINAELSKLGLDTFHKNVVKTVGCWFEGDEYDEISKIITRKVLGSGAFGTREDAVMANAVKVKQNSKDSTDLKIKIMLRNVFLPFKNMCKLFPILKKLPFLLPFLWIWRGFKIVFFKGNRLKNKIDEMRTFSNDNVLEYERELEAVGLSYSFKE